ncbi:MAG TPA: tRNA threonylcarbamoyladenosine dehydratase [Clostridiales bacterium]|jgi:tRNA A37 threonylcarbamoyladenosine dehydratase|nr:tRNA threonylcarbamoyladenosine dehydratase [Clostridiales bacterium]
MEDYTARTRALLGDEAIDRLQDSRVLVFGLGGVGGIAVEALARSGVGCLGLVDFDTIDPTNINRQIIALETTIGQKKTDVMRERIKAIHPRIETIVFFERLTPENIDLFHLEDWDYIVDAIDDVCAKLVLIEEADRLGLSLISCMGAGNHLSPTGFKIADIKDTHTCPLARTIRQEASKRGIKQLKTVFNAKPPDKKRASLSDQPAVPASIMMGVGAAGLLLAAEVIRELSLSTKNPGPLT